MIVPVCYIEIATGIECQTYRAAKSGSCTCTISITLGLSTTGKSADCSIRRNLADHMIVPVCYIEIATGIECQTCRTAKSGSCTCTVSITLGLSTTGKSADKRSRISINQLIKSNIDCSVICRHSGTDDSWRHC